MKTNFLKNKFDQKIKMNKRGAILGLSFSTLFSVFLIIIFVSVAFYAINAFLNSQKCAQIGMFVNDLKNEVDSAWNTQLVDSEFKKSLPSNIDYVCFADFSKPIISEGLEGEIGEEIWLFEGTDKNLFFYPLENTCDLADHKISHIDIEKITTRRNPYCIPNKDGLVKLSVKKEFNEALVTLG